MPAGTPQEIVKMLGDEIRNIIKGPDVQARIEALGFLPADTPAESATWSELIRRWAENAVAESGCSGALRRISNLRRIY